MRPIPRPEPDEFPAYARIYIDRIPADGRLLEHMAASLASTVALVRSLSDATLLRRYAPDKWTLKQVLVHVIDDERIYTYRALRFARGDSTELPGFEQDDYARLCGADERRAADILAELAAVRESTIALFRGFDDAALLRSGVADGKRASVRALGYHIAGHEAHHMAIVRERYLAT